MGKKKANKAQPGQREFTEQGPVGAEPANTVEDSPLEQRTELIKEYLSRQLCQPLAPGDAASPAGNAGSQAGSTQSPGSAAGGSPAGGVPGDAGSSAAGVAEVGLTSPALLQRVTAAACLRQAELKPALAAHLATTQLGKGKAEQLVELQQQLGKQQAPVAYQRLSALLKPGKRAPVLSTDVARFDGALSKEVLDSTALKDLARMLQREPQSAFSAVVAAGQHMKIHINAEDVFARKGLWKKALPSVSELRPCPEEAGGAGAGRPALELGSLAHLICREAASLAYASPASRQRGQQAGSGSDDLEEESEQPWQASLLPEGERYMRRLLKGLDLADSVLATGDPAVATFQTFHAPTFNRRSWHVAQSLRCFLRGHLLMRLQQQAAAAGVQGNSPQAQDMVRPLQLLLDRHKVPLRDLLAAACAQAGAPGSSCQLQLAAALLRAASQQAKRGLLWRPAALLLLLLQQEQQAAVGTAPVEGIQGMAAVLDQLDATGMDEAAGALFPEAEQAALRFILASLRHADELATPALRRSLAEGVLLALQRMQQRERLTTQLVDALAGCSALQLASSDRGMPDFKKLTEVPPDQLLMLYCTVAIAFGCAFQTPEDLGPTPSPGGAPSAPPGADFAAAGAVARAGLSWEADPACSPDGARLRLNAHAVQSALHQVAQGSKKQPEHCAAGWCSDCHTVVADPSANPSHVLTAVAGLAAGSLSMPGSSLSAGVGSAGGWQDAALQIHGALLGVPAAGENQALLSRLPVDPGQGARLARLLCLMGSICFVALEVLKECMFRHLEALVAVHSIVHAVQDGAALKGSPGRLRELAERALLFGEFEQMAAAARRLLTHLETLGAMSRWHASEDEMQAMLSSPGSEASLYAGWLHRCLAEERVWLNQEMAHLSSLLEPSEGAAKWPKALSVSLSVLAAKMESHMRDCSPGELFFPDPGLATALVQGAARVRAARALFDNAFDGLRGAGDALFWRCKDVLGQLRQACAVQLLAPFEELAVQRVLGARWEAEAGGAPLVAAESAVSGVTAAERAAAEAAAELEQEEAEARAAAQRRQQKQLAKQRAAEQRRLQQLEEERARRRREEEERARQAQEEAQRQAEAEAAAAAAREEGDRQRREFLLSLKQADEAGQAEDVAEAAEERGGSGSQGPAQGSGADVARGERSRHRRARGGRAQFLKEEDVQAATAAAATAADAAKPQEASAGLQQPVLAQQRPTGAAPAGASVATKTPKAVEQLQQQAAEPPAASRRRHQVIPVRGRQQPGAQQVAAAAAPAGQQAAPAAPAEQQAAPKVAPAGQQAAPRVAPAGQQAAPRVAPAGQQAAAKVAPAVQQAAPKVAPAGQQAAPKVAPFGEQAAPKVAPDARGQGAASAGQQPPAAQGAPASGQERLPPAVEAALGARSGNQHQRRRRQASRQLPHAVQQPGAPQPGHELPGGEPLQTLQTLEHVAQAAVPLSAAASVPESAASAAGSTAPGGAGTAVKPPAAAAPSSGSSAAQQANLQSSQGAAARPHNEVAPTPYPATAPAQQQHAPRAQDQQQRWVDDTAQGAALLVGMPAAQQAGTVPPPVSAAPGTYGLPPPQARVPHGSAAGAPPLPAWPHHAVHAGPSSQAHVWGTGLYGQGVYMPAAPAVPPTAHAQHTQHAQHAQQPWCYQHSWHAQQAPQAAPGGAALEPAPAAASHAKPWAEQAAQWVAPALDPPPATERAHAPAAVPSATQREKEAPHTPPPDTAAAPPRVPSPATEQAASPVFEGAASPTADRAPSPAAASGPAAAPAAAPEPAPAPVVPEAAAAKPAAAGPRPGTWAALAAERPQSPARPHQEQQQQQQQQPQGAATTTVAPPASQRQPGKDDLVPLGPAQVAARAGSKPAAAAAAAAKPSGAAGTRTEAAPGGQARGAPQPARLSFLAALAPDQAEMAALALPGLRNEGGEFNCFLNVVVQCLWRCRAFREAVLSWGPEVHAADPVLSALHSLLSELSALDFARQDAAAAAAAGASGRRNGRPVIDTTPLREALNALPGQEFKIGEMSDAGELLLVLYEHIKEAAPGPPAAQLDAAFGLHVREAVRCPKCPKTTQKQSYTQYFCNVSAAALRTSLRVSDPGFGARLRAIEDEHQKSCDTDVGGCGALYPVSHSLEGAPPRVFTLQLAWESHSEEPSAIAATMRAVGEQVDLRQLYEGVPPGTASRYRLRAMVCYYLRHYSAFVRLPELGERWVMFDDASTSAVGSWAEVRRRYEGGRVQPSVLFYEAAA